MRCHKCGATIYDSSALFCMQCGCRLNQQGSQQQNSAQNRNSLSNSIKDKLNDITDTLSDKLNDITGNDGGNNLSLRDLFTNITKKHTKRQAELIFICGTERTTPPENRMVPVWEKPWLYSRVFLFMFIVFAAMSVMLIYFGNPLAAPGAILMGSFMMPFTIMFMTYELNVPKNISFFDMMVYFFIGASISLVISMIMYARFGGNTSVGMAFVAGIVEEIAKIAAICVFLIRNNKCKYILNGVLIGAAVGAGFAAFESAGYAFCAYLDYETVSPVLESMLIILLRGILAFGGHVAWAAIEGGAILMIKGDSGFGPKCIINKRVLILFAMTIILHILWDMPLIDSLTFEIVKDLVLSVIAWVILFSIINSGLSQVSRVANNGPLLK